MVKDLEKFERDEQYAMNPDIRFDLRVHKTGSPTVREGACDHRCS
jgi:hypothetical protein